MARILLIEDDADVRLVVEHILVDGGYEVDTAEHVAAGAALLDSGPYDLVVADGRLPDGTGIELADKASALGIPALIITGYAFILRELARDPDRYRILLKPLRPAEILNAVQATLDTAA
ncbi:MAG TPA: response regulator [Stellaceae bacterium]|nr:response regulator [Stellaceae bacterium]